MAVIKPEDLEIEVPLGHFDTDNGGRQPQVRDALRGLVSDMKGLADAGWNEAWRHLTTEDALVIAQVLGKLQMQNARLVRVRVTQSNSSKRRGRHRG